MRTKGKQVTILALLLAGAVLFIYGVFFHAMTIVPAEEQQDSDIVAQSEMALIREVSVGGLRRDASGQITRTYTGAPPRACPT
ncbi:MAG: hypothetical protein ACYTEQ_12560 [Planctomycetota bacterium]|jgi:hypothetical protein